MARAGRRSVIRRRSSRGAARGTAAGAALIVLALIAALVPLSALTIERWYSRGVYTLLQPAITSVSNLLPIALLDVAAAAVITAVGLGVRRVRGRSYGEVLKGSAWTLAVASAVLYLSFLLLWGLNYRRLPLEEKLVYDASRITPEAARSLALRTVDEVNAGYRAAHAPDDGPMLAHAFFETQRLLGNSRPVALGVPKRSLLAFYFRWAAIDGMTDPFFLEVILNPEVLPIEHPFVLAHEWAHLAGYADESEANFVAWLTCIRGSAHARYSGWLSLYGHLAGAVSRDDRRMLAGKLDPGPREDLRSIAARLDRAAPIVRHAAREVYDSYLKANRVPEGIASYNAVVRLALGTAFENGWAPRMTSSR